MISLQATEFILYWISLDISECLWWQLNNMKNIYKTIFLQAMEFILYLIFFSFLISVPLDSATHRSDEDVTRRPWQAIDPRNTVTTLRTLHTTENTQSVTNCHHRYYHYHQCHHHHHPHYNHARVNAHHKQTHRDTYTDTWVWNHVFKAMYMSCFFLAYEWEKSIRICWMKVINKCIACLKISYTCNLSSFFFSLQFHTHTHTCTHTHTHTHMWLCSTRKSCSSHSHKFHATQKGLQQAGFNPDPGTS